MGHWAVRVSSDPILNPPCLFLPRCDTSVSSLLLLRDAGSAPLPRLPALVRSRPRLPAPPSAAGSAGSCGTGVPRWVQLKLRRSLPFLLSACYSEE